MWRDFRTNIVLAAGAVQNWPTPSEEKQMRRERLELQRKEAELFALCLRLPPEEVEKKVGKEVGKDK